MKIKIDRVLKNLRTQRNLSQENLAETMGVSVQAVSKWENGLSCPDIAALPELADFFGVTLDFLLTGQESKSAAVSLPDDGVLRVVQAVGSKLLSAEECKEKINLVFPEKSLMPCEELKVEVHGECGIEGDVYGSVTAKCGVACGNVEGNVNAGNGVACGNVGGNVNAGNGVAAGHVGESVSAGDSVNCGNVGESVSAGDGISCGDIGGDAECGGNIECKKINGKVSCQGDITIRP